MGKKKCKLLNKMLRHSLDDIIEAVEAIKVTTKEPTTLYYIDILVERLKVLINILTIV